MWYLQASGGLSEELPNYPTIQHIRKTVRKSATTLLRFTPEMALYKPNGKLEICGILLYITRERKEMGKSFRVMESKPFYQNGVRPQHTYSFPDESLLKELNVLSNSLSLCVREDVLHLRSTSSNIPSFDQIIKRSVQLWLNSSSWTQRAYVYNLISLD